MLQISRRWWYTLLIPVEATDLEFAARLVYRKRVPGQPHSVTMSQNTKQNEKKLQIKSQPIYHEKNENE